MDSPAAAAILTLLDARAPDATVCPSEVARAMAPEGWRALMPEVREAARALARAGRVEVRQRGVAVDPDGEWRGPVRIGRRR